MTPAPVLPYDNRTMKNCDGAQPASRSRRVVHVDNLTADEAVEYMRAFEEVARKLDIEAKDGAKHDPADEPLPDQNRDPRS